MKYPDQPTNIKRFNALRRFLTIRGLSE